MQPLEKDNIRLAATVMLVKDSPAGMHVYMVQRPGKGAFPDLHVFPGGKVDDDDWTPEYCFDLSDARANELLGIAAGGLRYWVAVARECFEECGVLLARKNGQMLDFTNSAVQIEYAEYRRAILAGELSFCELCKQQNLLVACDLLAYFSHWITPEIAPRRFDTRFFLAGMPADQSTLAHIEEAAGEHWVTPQDALSAAAAGTWQLIDPTLRSLETLCQYDCLADALVGVQKGDHLMPLTDELNKQGMQTLR